MLIERNYSLRDLNTFGIEANAAFFTTVKSATDLSSLLRDDEMRLLPKLILGGGSNILLTGDFNGLVIQNKIEGIEIVREDADHVWVKAGGGVVWHEFVLYTVQHGWGGVENLSLIPGTVGAAPMQNIGAYGVEIKDSFEELEAISLEDYSIRRFSRDECRFGYRDSIFKREAKGKYLIVSVTFRLFKKPILNTTYGAIEQELSAMGVNQPTITDVSSAVIQIRRSKLPDPALIGNAGSFFKNPEVEFAHYEKIKSEHPGLVAYPASHGKMKLAAGWLIEQCGWKGKQVGNVGMHSKQALVLVNYGNATGPELLEHAKKVQKSVLEKFGVLLEMEVNIV